MRRTPSSSSTCGRQPKTSAAKPMSRHERFRSPSRGGWNSGSSGPPTAAATAECSCAVRGLHAGADVEALPAARVAGRPDEGVHHVVDEHVVAGVGAVAEHLGGLARQQRLGEDRHHARLAVRVLARAVDVGRRDVRTVQAVQVPEGVQVDLPGHLALRHTATPDRWAPSRWSGTAAGRRRSTHPTRCARPCARRHAAPLRPAGRCRSTLTEASNCGSATERRTSICAARWNTTSGRCSSKMAVQIGCDDVGLDEDVRRRCRPDARGWSRAPVAKLSSPTTVCPSASRRSTSVDPMKPAAPVTSARTGPPYRREMAVRRMRVPGRTVPSPDRGAAGIRAVLAFGGYFYWDDLILVGRAGTQGLLSPSYLFDDHDGHVMPAALPGGRRDHPAGAAGLDRARRSAWWCCSCWPRWRCCGRCT